MELIFLVWAGLSVTLGWVDVFDRVGRVDTIGPYKNMSIFKFFYAIFKFFILKMA